ncbi:MAG TPA: Calx-beta domain-containing protein [Nevskiaceae bacterium]|nr:Calx-beta domain-containing protein [Nevskiaceae bacterium]
MIQRPSSVLAAGFALLLAPLAAQAGSLEFSRAQANIGEDRERLRITVNRSGDLSQAASVRLSSSPGSARNREDFRPLNTTLSWAAGDGNPKSVVLRVVNDEIGENTEDLTLSLSEASGDTLGTVRQQRVRILDNDVGFTFRAGSVQVNEGAGTASVIVDRIGGDTQSFAFTNVFAVGGSARAAQDEVPATGDDYRFAFANLDFPGGGARSQTVSFPVFQDAFDEPNETIELELRDFSGSAGPIARSVVTLVDDDSLFATAAATLEAGETDRRARISVRRLNGAVGAASVDFTTVDGTALASADYTALSGTLSWADGDARPKTVTVTLRDDTRGEADEGFYLVLSNPVGGLIRSNPATAVVIPANDGTARGFVNTANRRSPLGTNTSFVADFTNEYPFANYFKNARFWTSFNSASGQRDDREFELDADFYITRLKTDQQAVAFLFTNTGGEPMLNGLRLVVRYDGDGQLDYRGGIRLLSRSPGRDLVQLDPAAAGGETTVQVVLSRTNPANHLRNIRMTREGGICRSNPLAAVAAASACTGSDFVSFEQAASAGEIQFNPEYLDSIKAFGGLRFLGWQFINQTAASEFGDRRLPSHAFWSIGAPNPGDEFSFEDSSNPHFKNRGVPFEVIIAVANLMDLDPWITLPHRASDDYFRQTARLFRDQLEPGRRVYIEYTNENWNFQFPQSTFILEESRRLGLDVPEGQGFLRLYSQRAQQMFAIFDEEFGAAARARVLRTFATQAVNPFFTEVILNEGNGVAVADYFSIAPYFADTLAEQDKVDEFKRLCREDGLFDWLLNDNNAILDFGSLDSLDRAVAAQKAVVDRFSIPLITYEGGQHMLAGQGFEEPFTNFALDEELNACMDAANGDPRMGEVYRIYLDNWRGRSDEIFFHLLHVEPWSAFGRWGSKEFLSQPREDSPKFDALMDYIETRPLSR